MIRLSLLSHVRARICAKHSGPWSLSLWEWDDSKFLSIKLLMIMQFIVRSSNVSSISKSKHNPDNLFPFFFSFPDNLILTADHRTVKLADFGLAREESLTEMMTAETGTYRWMAPEVLLNF